MAGLDFWKDNGFVYIYFHNYGVSKQQTEKLK